MVKESKKHKKKSKKYKKQKSSRHKSSSNNSSSSEDEWVEQDPASSVSAPQATPASSVSALQATEEKEKLNQNMERDDWMSNSALFACVSRGEIRQRKEKRKDKAEADKYMLDKLGQTDRELNPYWKDGGTGLPAECPATADSLRQAAVTVGDQGVAWLRRALQRAKEQAVEQRRPLEQVVAERWGSLEKLENMILAAEEREEKCNKYDRQNKYKSSSLPKYKFDDERKLENKIRYSSRKNKNEKYSNDSKKDNHSKKHFAKPNSDNDSSSETDGTKSSFRSLYKHRENRDNRKSNNHYKDSNKETKSFAKPQCSSDDNSDHKHERLNKYGKDSKEEKGRKKFAKPSDGSSDEEKCVKKHERSRYDVDSKKTKERSTSKRFSKSSSISSSGGSSSNSSSSEEDDNRHKNYDKRKYNVKDRRSEARVKESRKIFEKPNKNSDKDCPASIFEPTRSEYLKSHSSSRGWRKKPESHGSGEKPSQSNEPGAKEREKATKNEPKEEAPAVIEEPMLTEKEMNDLGAKLVKAELLGNQELAEELKAKLDRARVANSNRPKKTNTSEEVVILTHTDSRGFTRPVTSGEPVEPTGGRRKAKKVETHSEGKRMRYFADDDKYSLQEMFQREKLSTVEDSNEVFAKLASKGVGRDDSARDMEDVFEETARMEEADGRKQVKERQQAIEHSKRVARSLDSCQWCLESQKMLKHLIVAIGNSCYLCVPPYQSLTEHHCLIIPSNHTPCATQLDEDIWAEMQDFRKSVVKMFLSQDEDVVFFESARYLNRFPHMVLNCVPLPKETGDLAPIYFKKAIQECEQEWSNNKKLVDLRGRDVRRAVPKGLPYFAVDFGTESGFAHVIEDEQLFPLNFAQEIIGGMLDLDHTIWRKQRKQTFEEQSKKVIQLGKLWNPFDFTKNKN